MNAPAQSAAARFNGAKSPWIWLLAGAALLPFTDGRNTVALAAWLAPALLLRFSRAQPNVYRTAALYVVLVITHAIAFRRMIPIPGFFYYVYISLTGFTAILPYLLDRVLQRRVGGLRATLVFPLSMVAIDFCLSHGPHGSWGSVAYSQAGDLPLLQSLSVFGLSGIVFLIGWFAAVFNSHLDGDRSSMLTGKGMRAFAVVCVVVHLLGGARLSLFPPASKTVRIASLSPLKTSLPLPDTLVSGVLEGTAGDAEIRQFDATTANNLSDLLERSQREARAGAEIVFWSEGAVYVRKLNEAMATARGSEVARQNHVYLGMSLLIATPGQLRSIENAFILINPDGTTAFKYLKSRLTPGPESERDVSSDGKLLNTTTPFGRVSSAICFDTDFPPLISQAGRRGADIVLSPASDWNAIDPRHTQMAKFRAIEQGFNLVRQANLGLSAAFDYEGRQLSSMHDFQSEDLTLVSAVPTRGVRTIYSRSGDWFAWLCIAYGTLLVIRSLRVNLPSAPHRS